MRSKKSMWVMLAGFVVVLGLGSVAQAGGVGLSLKGGTTGLGGDVTVRLNENFNLRAGVGYYNMTDSFDQGKGEINLLNVPVLIDWHPVANSGFRISTGAVFNDNYLKISAQDQTVTIDDIDYDITDLDGKINFSNSISPYLGIGWGNAVGASSRWHFSADLGVIFVGSPKVKLSATAENPLFQDALDASIAEQISTFKDDAEQYQFYPVVTIGLSYSF